jgi:SAM-dependent methyltransferase
MQSNNSSHPFHRSGLAALSDLKTPEWRSLFTALEGEQAEFLAKEAEFRSTAYKWPHDPLHTWSRVWEYPYVYFHLEQQKRLWDPERMPWLVDLGSGVTFFPFAAARLGYKVTCADIDRICQDDLPRAARLFPHSPGKVDFRLIKDGFLPFGDAEIDCVYCISVLEHISDLEPTIREVHRILKPGGSLIVTIDLDLRGDAAIGIDDYKKLMHILRETFLFMLPETTLHPRDMLTSDAGPFSIRGSTGLKSTLIAMKQLPQFVLRKKRLPSPPFHLAVSGMLLQKV